METINIEKLVSMYNDENKGLEEIGKEIGKSKSTVQKMFSKNGYKLNKSIGKYENNISIETINQESNVSCETINNENTVSNETNVLYETMVNRTYAISEKIDRAIKIKSAIEGIKPVDIVRMALDSFIEDKYKNM